MTADKQSKAYGVLIFFVVILLLGSQFGLQHMFKQSSAELSSFQQSLARDRNQLNSRMSLSERYDAFQARANEHAGADRQFPVNGAELFRALNSVMQSYNIEFFNNSTTAGVQPGAPFILQISFSGRYYNLMKALAAIRESGFIMRIEEINLSADGDETVSGTMSIRSIAAQA